MAVESGPEGETGKETLSGMGGTGTGMPEVDCYAAGRKVKVLRDTGSSCRLVRAALVEGHRRTGDVRECILTDGTERQFETVRVHVQTPYYEGSTTKVSWSVSSCGTRCMT